MTGRIAFLLRHQPVSPIPCWLVRCQLARGKQLAVALEHLLGILSRSPVERIVVQGLPSLARQGLVRGLIVLLQIVVPFVEIRLMIPRAL